MVNTLKLLKETVLPILAFSKPYVTKVIEATVIPAAKTWIYTSLQQKKDKAVSRLLILAAKYKNETDETKKKAHKIGLDLGVEALEAIGKSMVDAAQKIKSEL